MVVPTGLTKDLWLKKKKQAQRGRILPVEELCYEGHREEFQSSKYVEYV